MDNNPVTLQESGNSLRPGWIADKYTKKGSDRDAAYLYFLVSLYLEHVTVIFLYSEYIFHFLYLQAFKKRLFNAYG